MKLKISQNPIELIAYLKTILEELGNYDKFHAFLERSSAGHITCEEPEDNHAACLVGIRVGAQCNPRLEIIFVVSSVSLVGSSIYYFINTSESSLIASLESIKRSIYPDNFRPGETVQFELSWQFC